MLAGNSPTATGMILESIPAIADIDVSHLHSHSHCESTTSFTDSIDSTAASHALTPECDSSGQPLQYPPTVLWTFEDCKTDPSIDFTAANKARVALHKIIWHPNGTMITNLAVKAITSRARPIVNKILAQVPSHIQHKKIGKVYFWTTYPTEWDAGCQELESTQPLLKLCAGHWKAEFVLAQVIKSMKRGKKDRLTTACPASPKLNATNATASWASPEPNVTSTTAFHPASPNLDATNTTATATGAHPNTETPITTISEQSSHNGPIPEKRKHGDSNVQAIHMDAAPSQLPMPDDMAITPPATKKPKKSNDKWKKPQSECRYFQMILDFSHQC